jgi:hypothetical protein
VIGTVAPLVRVPLVVAVVVVAYWAMLVEFTVVHEAGHALAARLLGVPVRAVRIGGRGPAATATIGGVRLRVHLLPWGGATTLGTAGVSRPRRAMVLLAGSLANVVVAVICLRLRSVLPWLLLVAAVNALGVLNLVPIPPGGTRRPSGSDGWQLLHLNRPPAVPDDDRLLDILDRLATLQASYKAPDHRPLPPAGERLPVDDPEVRPYVLDVARVLVRLHAGPDGWDDAVEAGRAVFDRTPPAGLWPPDRDRLRRELASGLAWTLVRRPDPPSADVDEAESLVLAALDLAPGPDLDDTLALVRIRQGRFAEAGVLTEGVLDHWSDAWPQQSLASMLCTKGLIVARTGSPDDARDLADRAGAIDPDSPLLAELRATIAVAG